MTTYMVAVTANPTGEYTEQCVEADSRGVNTGLVPKQLTEWAVTFARTIPGDSWTVEVGYHTPLFLSPYGPTRLARTTWIARVEVAGDGSFTVGKQVSNIRRWLRVWFGSHKGRTAPEPLPKAVLQVNRILYLRDRFDSYRLTPHLEEATVFRTRFVARQVARQFDLHTESEAVEL